MNGFDTPVPGGIFLLVVLVGFVALGAAGGLIDFVVHHFRGPRPEPPF